MLLTLMYKVYINYIYVDPCVKYMYIAENTDHFNPRYRILAYLWLKIVKYTIFWVIYLYYALHFIHLFKKQAGVCENIADITVQIAPNKEYAKSRPASHDFKC